MSYGKNEEGRENFFIGQRYFFKLGGGGKYCLLTMQISDVLSGFKKGTWRKKWVKLTMSLF